MANRGWPKITTGIPRSEAERKALEEWKKIFSVKTIKLSANSIFKPDHAEQLINIFFGRCYNATRIAYLGSLYALHVVNSHADANDILLYFLKMKCYEFNQVAEEFDDIDVRNTMKNLMYNQDWTEGDVDRLDKMNRLYTEVQRRCTPSFTRYLNMVQYVECKWFESLWFFIIIQREIGIFIEQHQSLESAWINHKKFPTIYQQSDQPLPPKIRNFTVIPMCTTKLKHIKFDHTNLLALLSQMNVVPHCTEQSVFCRTQGRCLEYFVQHGQNPWNL